MASKRPWIILVAAGVSGIGTELVMGTRFGPTTYLTAFVACLAQAGVVHGLRVWLWKVKAAKSA